jgi:hypothetical protein
MKEAGMVFGLGVVVYLVFFLLGFGFSTLVTFRECEKTDQSKNATQAAIWATYPTVGWYVIRTFDFLRGYFDRFYLMFDGGVGNKVRASWISIGYVLTLAAVAGIYGLSSTSITEVCIPDIDEATRFKNNMIQKQKEKDDGNENEKQEKEEEEDDEEGEKKKKKKMMMTCIQLEGAKDK